MLELVRRSDGAFDLFLNGQPDRTNIPEKWFNEEVCVRFGFSGEEYWAFAEFPTYSQGQRNSLIFGRERFTVVALRHLGASRERRL